MQLLASSNDYISFLGFFLLLNDLGKFISKVPKETSEKHKIKLNIIVN